MIFRSDLKQIALLFLGASCLALYLVGCGSGGGGESPVEIRVSNNGDFQIRSKADSVTIQGVKLNRGNCVSILFR
ncbi:hypothetical protein VN1064_13410 [Helicobacter pylori]